MDKNNSNQQSLSNSPIQSNQISNLSNQENDSKLNNIMSTSKRIRKLSVEEVDLVKKYRKGREQNIIKVRKMRKSAQNLKDNFKAVKQSMIKYLNNIEDLIEERCLEIEEKVTQLENQCIIPEIEDIKNNYESQKSKDEECFNEKLFESNLNDTHIEIIEKLSSCKKNISGDFDSYTNSKATVLSDYIQQLNVSMTNLHQFADNDESQLLKQLKCINNINYLKLIQKLRERTYIKSDEVEQVMLSIQRSDFTSNPYEDRAQHIGFNTTISAPHMHGLTLEIVREHIKDSVKCLDIGIGSGWMTTALAKMMKTPTAICYGLDHLQGILNLSKKNILKSHAELLQSGKIVLVKGDGREGLEDYAPFDVIHLGAAATLKAVNKFIHQLAPNGILCGPIIKDAYNQEFMVIKKNEDGIISKETILHVTYGSLGSIEEQYPDRDEEEYYENEDDQITFQQQVIHIDKQPEGTLDDEEEEDDEGEEEEHDELINEDEDSEDNNHDEQQVSSSSLFRSLRSIGRHSSDAVLNRLQRYQDAFRYLFHIQGQNNNNNAQQPTNPQQQQEQVNQNNEANSQQQPLSSQTNNQQQNDVSDNRQDEDEEEREQNDQSHQIQQQEEQVEEEQLSEEIQVNKNLICSSSQPPCEISQEKMNEELQLTVAQTNEIENKEDISHSQQIKENIIISQDNTTEIEQNSNLNSNVNLSQQSKE